MTNESPKYCTACHYRLDHLPENRCPECGRAFDPEDPTTFLGRNVISIWARRGRPPGNWTLAATALFGILLLVGASMPKYETIGASFCMAHVMLIALVMDYGFRIAAVSAVHVSTPPRACKRTLGRRRWRWVPLPLLALMLLSAYYSPWLLQIRFGLSRPAFERTVQGLKSGTHTNTGSQFVGLYHVTGIGRGRTGEWRFHMRSGLGKPVGLWYDPSDTPKGHKYLKLAPCWYAGEW